MELCARVCTFIRSCAGLTGVGPLGCDETLFFFLFLKVNFGEGVATGLCRREEPNQVLLNGFRLQR